MKFTKTARWGLLAALAAASFSVARPAFAYVSRLAYSACSQDWGSSYSFFAGGNDLPANTLILMCPVESTTDLPHQSIGTLNIHYDDNSPGQSVTAFRCVFYAGAAGGNCGNSVNSSNGSGGMTIPNTPASFAADWNVSTNFAAIGVYLPPKSGGARSAIKGYYMSH